MNGWGAFSGSGAKDREGGSVRRHSWGIQLASEKFFVLFELNWISCMPPVSLSKTVLDFNLNLRGDERMWAGVSCLFLLLARWLFLSDNGSSGCTNCFVCVLLFDHVESERHTSFSKCQVRECLSM